MKLCDFSTSSLTAATPAFLVLRQGLAFVAQVGFELTIWLQYHRAQPLPFRMLAFPLPLLPLPSLHDVGVLTPHSWHYLPRNLVILGMKPCFSVWFRVNFLLVSPCFA